MMMRDIPESEIANLIRDVLAPSAAIYPETCDSLSAARGAYALVMRFDAPVRFLRGQASHVVTAGWYAYAGSAYGLGGLRARLHRHFRRDKTLHWHIDHLTAAADRIFAVGVEGGSECGVATRLVGSGRLRHGLTGIGSSDYNSCTSHLLEWR